MNYDLETKNKTNYFCQDSSLLSTKLMNEKRKEKLIMNCMFVTKRKKTYLNFFETSKCASTNLISRQGWSQKKRKDLICSEFN